MHHPADLAFSHLLVKNGIVPYETVQRELEILAHVLALGFRVNLARTMRDRGKLDRAAIETIRGLPRTPQKEQLLAEHLRRLEAEVPIEPPITDLLVDNGLVTRPDLDAALAKLDRAKTLGIKKRPLEALVDLGVLLPEVALALFDVWRRAEESALQPWDLAFCRLAAAGRIASSGDLQLAVAIQRRLEAKLKWRRPVAEILYALGKVARTSLEGVQATVRTLFPAADPTWREAVMTTEEEEGRVAALLAPAGSVSAAQLQECADLRAALEELGLKRRLGELLLMRGYVRADALAAPSPPSAAAAASDPSAAMPPESPQTRSSPG